MSQNFYCPQCGGLCAKTTSNTWRPPAPSLSREDQGVIILALAEQVKICDARAEETKEGPLDMHFYWRQQSIHARLLSHTIQANGLAFTGKSAFKL